MQLTYDWPKPPLIVSATPIVPIGRSFSGKFASGQLVIIIKPELDVTDVTCDKLQRNQVFSRGTDNSTR